MSSKKTLSIFISLLFTCALFYLIFSELSLPEFAEIISKVNPQYLLFYGVLSISALLLRALRYHYLIRTMEGTENCPSYPKFLVVTGIRNAFVDSLPARLGEVSFFYVINRLGVPLTAALSAFGICFAFDIVILFMIIALFFMGGAVFMFSAGPAESGLAQYVSGDKSYIIILLALVLLTIGVFAIKNIHRLIYICVGIAEKSFRKSWAVKVYEKLKVIAGELQKVSQGKQFYIVAFLTLGLRLAKYVSLYVLLIAVTAQFGVSFENLNPLFTTSAFILGEASASLPISGIMGFGAYELTTASLLKFSEVAVPSWTGAIFANHLITQVFGYTIGFLAVGVFWVLTLKKQ